MKQYYKCTLISDIVVNASLATEGNMTTLDYIPGSNFLGIIASKFYKEGKHSKEELYELFHSNVISFGDALISKNEQMSYTVPFSLFQDKLEKGLNKEGYNTWVHHLLKGYKPLNDVGEIRQLKQHRGGFLNKEGVFIKKVEKKFSLKSAYDREERRSDDGKMFGFESIRKGQEFIFSVIFQDDKYEKMVSEALVGERRIGKSKTAQYGKVNISKIKAPSTFESEETKNKRLVVYAESNLCFLNDYGQATFQPKPSDFGIEGLDDEKHNEEETKYGINWNLSQIRTYSYSPWNAHRNTSNTQRDVITKGSVFVIEVKEDTDLSKLKTQVGEYNAEGLGRVIYNPEFLEADENGLWSFKIKKKPKKRDNDVCFEEETVETNPISITSALGNFLKSKNENYDNERIIGEDIIEFLKGNDGKTLRDKDISKSQWGAIRTKSILARSVQDLKRELFETKEAYLNHGIAAEKIWDWRNGIRRDALERIIDKKRMDYKNDEMVLKFIAALASQISKLNKL